ncbi:hypothetical protein [Vibrio sp. H11]|uniref:hypothetical protein n=1 Tax=Vibrio sp. H11 TaxID=2565928 RepID=UPI0010A60431|nr:hypothetical protein [Vibrio sp. H11]
MKYQSSYLRAESYEAFFTACVNAGLVSEGEIITTSHDYSMILIGTLYKETGKILKDSEGNDYPEKVAIPGYHVNLRAKQPVGLEHLAVEPDNILVEWA